jgi:FAD/FMN-containing dehydrogenase
MSEWNSAADIVSDPSEWARFGRRRAMHCLPSGIPEVLPGQDRHAGAAVTLFTVGTPDIVVRPADVTEVAAALRDAAREGMAVSVMSGGAGLSTGGPDMLIDLRRMADVTLAGPAGSAGTRLVRIGGGATWGAVADALAPRGLAITACDTREVGVGGLTLAGGIGWLVRRYGLAIDNLTGAEVVTADGRIRHVSGDQEADLFWALRGGGGNFGVVTAFEFAAQRVPSVHFGSIGYQAGAAEEVAALIAGWRDAMRASDEDLTTVLTLVPPMMGRPAAAVVRCCYAGPDPAAALAPLRKIGTVTRDDIALMGYADMLEDATYLPPGTRFEMRNSAAPVLSDDLIGAVAALFGGQLVLALRALGGAMGRVPTGATAFAHRDAEALIIAGMPVPPGVDSEPAFAAWAPLVAQGSGVYAGFFTSAQNADITGVYPPDTYRRLAEVKGQYDPDNVFGGTFNARPGTGTAGVIRDCPRESRRSRVRFRSSGPSTAPAPRLELGTCRLTVGLAGAAGRQGVPSTPVPI